MMDQHYVWLLALLGTVVTAIWLWQTLGVLGVG